MEQSRGLSRRALGGALGAVGRDTPALPLLCLPRAPSLPTLCSGFPQAPLSLLFSPSISSGVPESEARVSLGCARALPALGSPRGSWSSAGTLPCSELSWARLFNGSLRPGWRCPHTQGGWQGGPSSPKAKPIPGEGAPGTLGSAAEPGLCIGF